MERARGTGPDTVAVWDTSGDDQSAQWGEIMTLAARRRGRQRSGGVSDPIMMHIDEIRSFPIPGRWTVHSYYSLDPYAPLGEAQRAIDMMMHGENNGKILIRTR